MENPKRTLLDAMQGKCNLPTDVWLSLRFKPGEIAEMKELATKHGVPLMRFVRVCLMAGVRLGEIEANAEVPK